MKVIHTADIHLGQVIYQSYGRADEHSHFFSQLKGWCCSHRPDALLVSGDLFDIQQPGASAKEAFTRHFVDLIKACPGMAVIMIAGNHDSASRLNADREIWEMNGVHIIGLPPSSDRPEGWQERYVVRLDCGYVVAFPYMTGDRREVIQSVLDMVARENDKGLPVFMMGHLAVAGADVTGHDLDIGTLKVQKLEDLGSGYDYLALGHLHRPQTIGHPEDMYAEEASYPSGVVRYSGSPLHVSCDETYPHSVSLVQVDRHGGDVSVKQLKVSQYRHFHILPEDGSSFTDVDAALAAIKAFADEHGKGYFRLRMSYDTAVPSNFNQSVYELLALYKDEVRYNPKTIWTGMPEKTEQPRPVFEVAELQQMTDPMTFVEKTKDQYPELDMEELRAAFDEVSEEVRRMKDSDNGMEAEQ